MGGQWSRGPDTQWIVIGPVKLQVDRLVRTATLLHAAGWSQRAVARQLQLGPDRVRQLLHELQRQARVGLSAAGISPWENVLAQAIRAGLPLVEPQLLGQLEPDARARRSRQRRHRDQPVMERRS